MAEDDLTKSLTRIEERTLFRRLAKKIGDPEPIKKRIILSHLKFVISIAKIRAISSKQFINFIEKGNRALLKALKLYDYRKGYGFATFAIWYIRQAMHTAYRTQSAREALAG